MRRTRSLHGMAGLLFLALALGGVPSTASAQSATGPGLELHVLDCGTLDGMDAEPFLPDFEERPKRLDMVNRCFLVVHPKGTMVWDAGLPLGFSARLLSWLYWIVTLGGTSIEMAPPLVEQIEALGFSAAEIDYVAFSHSHFDHVGQADAFTNSTWLVQRTEHDWVFDPEFDNDSVQRSLIEPMKDAETMILDGDHDVFGDGSVVVLSAPGHTPGHQCLFLDFEQAGPVVLSGDLYHSLLNRERREPPDFNTDREQTRASMDRIESFVQSRGATLWIQHAPESGPQAPAHIR